MHEAKFTQASGTFFMECSIVVNIRAKADVVWRLLTDAPSFPRWNSTVTRIEGEIREGGKLRVHVPGTERTFTPTVTGVAANQRMTWTGGFAPMFKGVRTFQLTPREDGSTDFAMAERFSGLMLPMIKGSLPDFAPVFKAYAGDLQAEAERIGTGASTGAGAGSGTGETAAASD